MNILEENEILNLINEIELEIVLLGDIRRNTLNKNGLSNGLKDTEDKNNGESKHTEDKNNGEKKYTESKHTEKNEEMLKVSVNKMYSYYAVDMCINKLEGNKLDESKDGLLRTKEIFSKLHHPS